MIQRCEKLPWTILKNGKRSKNRFIRCHTKERNHSREESGGSTDVGGASHRETDVLVESRVSKHHHSQSLDSGAHTGWVFCGQVAQKEHFLQEISCGCTREGFPIWVHRKPEIDVPGTVVDRHPVSLTFILIEEGSKILVVSEHWPWPHDLYKLGEIHKE